MSRNDFWFEYFILRELYLVGGTQQLTGKVKLKLVKNGVREGWVW
jgi:hypothetical protein